MRKALVLLTAGVLINTSILAYADTAPSDQSQNFTSAFALTSNYVFRGISQTDNLPAVQGGVTYTFDNGIYFNVWGSNVKFPSDEDATVEFDTVAGWKGNLDKFGYNLSLVRYNYPRASHLAYNELIGVANYSIFQGMVAYSNNEYNSHHAGIYYNGGVNYEIPAAYAFNLQDLSVQAGIGHFDLPEAAGKSYNDYNIGLTKKINKTYSVALQWTGTDGRNKTPPTDDDHIVFTVAANI